MVPSPHGSKRLRGCRACAIPVAFLRHEVIGSLAFSWSDFFRQVEWCKYYRQGCRGLKDSSHPIRNAIIAGVAVAAILGILRLAYGSFSMAIIKIWSGILATISFMGNKVVISRWFYYLLILCGLIILIRLGMKFLVKPKKQISLRDYTKDSFFGLVWRWEYIGNMLHRQTLTAYCPNDDTLLVDNPLREVSTLSKPFYCETCQDVYGPEMETRLGLEGKVMRQIDKKIRSGEWRKIVGDDETA